MSENVRGKDIVARVGGDEFLVLAVECKEYGTSLMAERIGSVLADNGVQASIGAGQRKADGTLLEAVQAADRAMYDCKRQRRTQARAASQG